MTSTLHQSRFITNTLHQSRYGWPTN